ncbi:UNVERIFIED_CONTAM: hypothetical protein HHA_250940 [Hammondia hammondi]|eukprot:XP_008888530.1 hypothetical protein HHA_250940 [Hammondia hammondi]
MDPPSTPSECSLPSSPFFPPIVNVSSQENAGGSVSQEKPPPNRSFSSKSSKQKIASVAHVSSHTVTQTSRSLSTTNRVSVPLAVGGGQDARPEARFLKERLVILQKQNLARRRREEERRRGVIVAIERDRSEALAERRKRYQAAKILMERGFAGSRCSPGFSRSSYTDTHVSKSGNRFSTSKANHSPRIAEKRNICCCHENETGPPDPPSNERDTTTACRREKTTSKDRASHVCSPSQNGSRLVLHQSEMETGDLGSSTRDTKKADRKCRNGRRSPPYLKYEQTRRKPGETAVPFLPCSSVSKADDLSQDNDRCGHATSLLELKLKPLRPPHILQFPSRVVNKYPRESHSVHAKERMTSHSSSRTQEKNVEGLPPLRSPYRPRCEENHSPVDLIVIQDEENFTEFFSPSEKRDDVKGGNKGVTGEIDRRREKNVPSRGKHESAEIPFQHTCHLNSKNTFTADDKNSERHHMRAETGFIEPLLEARLRNNRHQKDWEICHSFDEEEKTHVKDGETRKTYKAQEKGKPYNSQVSEEKGMASVPDDVFHRTWLLPNRKRAKYNYAFVCKDCEYRREKRCRKREPPEISSTPQDSQVRGHFTISNPSCNKSKVIRQDPKNSECRDGDGDRLCRIQEEGYVSEEKPSSVARATTGRMYCSREAQPFKRRHESPTGNVSSETPRPLHCLSDRHRPVSRSATNDEDRHREKTVPSGCQIDNGSDNCETSLHREAIVRRKEREFPDTSEVTVADRRLKTLIENQLTRFTFPWVSPHMRSLEQNEANAGVGNTESENRWNNMNDHHIARNKFGRPSPSPGCALPCHTATDTARLWIRPSSCSCFSRTEFPLLDEYSHSVITRRSRSSRRFIEKEPCLSATTERWQTYPDEGQFRSLPSATLPWTREMDISKSLASYRPPFCSSSTNSVMHYNERFRDSQYPKNRVFTTPVEIKTTGGYPSPRKAIPLTPTLSRHEQPGARRKESKNASKLEKLTDSCLPQMSTSSLSISPRKGICPQQQAKKASHVSAVTSISRSASRSFSSYSTSASALSFSFTCSGNFCRVCKSKADSSKKSQSEFARGKHRTSCARKDDETGKDADGASYAGGHERCIVMGTGTTAERERFECSRRHQFRLASHSPWRSQWRLRKQTTESDHRQMRSSCQNTTVVMHSPGPCASLPRDSFSSCASGCCRSCHSPRQHHACDCRRSPSRATQDRNSCSCTPLHVVSRAAFMRKAKALEEAEKKVEQRLLVLDVNEMALAKQHERRWQVQQESLRILLDGRRLSKFQCAASVQPVTQQDEENTRRKTEKRATVKDGPEPQTVVQSRLRIPRRKTERNLETQIHDNARVCSSPVGMKADSSQKVENEQTEGLAGGETLAGEVASLLGNNFCSAVYETLDSRRSQGKRSTMPTRCSTENALLHDTPEQHQKHSTIHRSSLKPSNGSISLTQVLVGAQQHENRASGKREIPEPAAETRSLRNILCSSPQPTGSRMKQLHLRPRLMD